MFKKLDRVKVDKFVDFCKNNTLLFDGAMGTQIQQRNPEQSLFGGHDGFNEYLNITAPKIIEDIHYDYLKAGANAFETNTFGANIIVMAEYGIGTAEKVYEISKKGAEIGRNAIKRFSAEKPGTYFVAGSIGPSTKLPSLGHISFKEMSAAYMPQIEGMMDGGADILIIETCQDILQVKCLIYTITEAFLKKGYMLPVMVSITLQQNGSMLVGTDLSAIVAALEDYEIVTSIGFNCALGPFEMEKHIEDLCRITKKMVSAMPNAGLPENIDGKLAYRLTPADFAGFISRFVSKYGVNIAGGCCGTTPAHIEMAGKELAKTKKAMRTAECAPQVSSLYTAWTLKQEPKPFIIGERTNANGSKAFRDLLLKDDFDGMLSIAKNQQNGGAHAIDLCVAYVGRDEKRDMHEVSKRFATAVNLPLVIDSTDPEVIEIALSNHGGKCIINSINLEDGGKKLAQVVTMAKKYNAALIALTIDENGMAKTCAEKLRIAARIHDICVKEYGIPAHDLIFDALTFTIGSGDETLREAGMETINAIRAIKEKFPEVMTSLGISNVSFGLKASVRSALNTIFLKHCIGAGLDMAIINPSGFLPFHKISKEDLAAIENLIFNKWDEGSDPLLSLLKYFDAKTATPESEAAAAVEKARKMNDDELLASRVIDGDKKGLEEIIDRILKLKKPLEIINGPLIAAMKKVGELFGAGIMQLPFVLQSAEVMKAAVLALEKHMEKTEYSKLGKMVLATVSGDVHDIGKNLVDIILTNNGFEVFNIGIKVPVEEMIKACAEKKCNIIGMSGLLVRSTQIMRDNLLELERRGLKYDVILGGAALTRKYVEQDLARLYSGRVFYAEDAFEGLTIMKKIAEGSDMSAGEKNISSAKPVNAMPAVQVETPQKIELFTEVPKVPFFGRKMIRGVDPAEIYPLLNKTTLFRGQWQYKRARMKKEDFDKMIADVVEPVFEDIKKKCREEKTFSLDCVYGYYPCASENDSIILFDPENNKKVIGRFDLTRQKFAGGLCISDFILPKTHGKMDVIGMVVVTVGHKVGEMIKKLFTENHYKNYLHLHGLSVEMAESFTEYMHLVMRKEMGILEEKPVDIQGMITQKYRGSRYSFGYPACPDMNSQKVMFDILKPEDIGVTLTEELEMVPEQSTSAIVIHHPQAKYFAV